MTDLQRELRALIDQELDKREQFRRGQVDSLGEGNTVNVRLAQGILNVRCTAGYPVRALKDEVLLIKKPGGGWEVLTKLNSEPLVIMTEADVTEDITRAKTELTNTINQAKADAIDSTDISWGTAAPGSGWTSASGSTPWVRDLGNGRTRVYFQFAAAPVVTPKPPAPPVVQPKPKPSTVKPSGRGSWRSGQTSDDVIQGNASYWGASSSNWKGGLFYGSRIADAIAGKTVASITIRLSRAKNAGGWNRKVPVRLALHDRSSEGNPTPTLGPVLIASLKPGDRIDVALPTSFVNAIKNGEAKGFCIVGTGSDNYLTLGPESGELVIKYT